MKFAQILLSLALFSAASNALAIPVDAPVDSVDFVDGDGTFEDVEDAKDLVERGKGGGKGTSFAYVGFPTGATCAGHTINKAALQDAAQGAAKLQSNGKQVGTRKYPHVFHNRNNEIRNFSPACKGSYLEFPIKTTVYSGGSSTSPEDPGADRIVINVSAKDKTNKVTVTFCGLMTHTGAPNNGAFVQCTVA